MENSFKLISKEYLINELKNTFLYIFVRIYLHLPLTSKQMLTSSNIKDIRITAAKIIAEPIKVDP